ncbi:fimbria/pilus periplasmic chaperone [Salmonella enterica subsp. enterica serovar Adelaide]|uniref:Fimbrial assembly protein n=1 Tax=Salmonella enterica subsp. enterica serovar Chester TaxID=149386 RepID=A0A5U8MCX9_SALET|nr:fimbrial assembly protein [Salmonella enterica subsp. enterica serovar Chester]EAA8170052.1 fimbrial assembly protein [Salmonella enterica]EAN8628606.1 fimbrial assembly protein [Salmonella enterica subsp. enterica serovar Adelaide]EBO4428098.1 fimbrial assembly protein [Salmonella enterica subsp. enterica]EBU8226967.1 fimbrial assembly protein [Salmonella enterica subsp. enterica serovar Nima]EBY6991805.1 fimbrial assembly protein [Salmonella enterica subsp. enterica serovar Pomona]ECD559
MINSTAVNAAVNVDRTRIVMGGDAKSLAVTLTNQSKAQPYLAQSWIDDASGKRSESYFLALPPLQRIDAGKKTQVRIMALPAAASLPKDRETLFYFNVREIPPKSDKENVLQVALQSRLKLFYRPESIKKKANDRSEEKITVTRQSSKLILNNPTPYYITLGYLGSDNKGSFPGFDSIMVAPFGSQDFNVKFSGDTLHVGYIDDFGGLKINQYHCSDLQCRLKEK